MSATASSLVAPAPDPSPAEIRLLVVDDHPALRVGLRDLLNDEPGFRVLAIAADAKEALAAAQLHQPDVAIVDYQLGGRDGLWLSRKLKRLRHPPRVIVYTAHDDGRLAAAALVAEADALVSKSRAGDDMFDTIRAVARGRRLLPGVPPRLGDVIRARLDHEQQAIFGMLWAGIGPQEIASTLDLPSVAVEARLCAMLATLQDLPAPARAR